MTTPQMPRFVMFAAAALVGLTGCAGDKSPTAVDSPQAPLLAVNDVTTPTPQFGKIKACNAATSNVSASFVSIRTAVVGGTFTDLTTVAPGECRVVSEDASLPGSNVAVTQTPSVYLTGITATRIDPPNSVIGPSTFANGGTKFLNANHGFTYTFTNTAPVGSIGDRVWNDADGDGVQESGEAGLNGWTVTVRDASNNVVGSATTSGDGNYTFPNLVIGTYSVCVTPQAGFTATYDLDGVASVNCTSATVTSGQSNTDVDFGYRAPVGSIGDRVWNDLDGDGVQDAGESGLTGVTVVISGPNGFTATTTSGVDGAYAFTDLFDGEYTVCVTTGVPAGFAQTYDATAPVTDGCATVTVGPNRTDVDFGYTPPRFSLGDRVWNDLNGDGVQDGNEAGIEGVVLSITGPDGFTTTATTGANGSYTVPNLLAGSYTVCVAAANLGAGQPLAGFSPTYDPDGPATPNCANVVVVGSNLTDVDFGYTPARFSLGDRVWNDVDGDGVQDGTEAGVAGVVLSITGPDGFTTTATTGVNGSYTVPNLLAGSYTVCVAAANLGAGQPLAGFSPTYDPDGPATPNCANVVVGSNRTDVDFGYQEPRGSIGDRVWNDTDADGVQDAGEAGLNGWTVTIRDASNTVVGTATTSVDGNYTFPNVVAGTYSVCVTPQAGFTPSSANCASVTVAAGQTRTDVDFGYRVPPVVATGSIGNSTWIDANGNGRLDAGEPALNGVQLVLGGAATATTSSASGGYLFSGLSAGSYTVTATAPSGFVFTTANAAGTNSTNDSNLSPASVSLATSSSSDLTIDFGFTPRAGGGQGCTPGYWKQSQHFDSWKWYTQTDMVDAVFGVTFRSVGKNNPTGPLTLLNAVGLNGNNDGEQLFRHGTAALLNAVYQSGVSSPYTAAQVITMVRNAWNSGNATTIANTKTLLANANELGCPLN